MLRIGAGLHQLEESPLESRHGLPVPNYDVESGPIRKYYGRHLV